MEVSGSVELWRVSEYSAGVRPLTADEKLWIKICSGLFTLIALMFAAASNPEDRVKVALVILGILGSPFLLYGYMYVLPVAIHEFGHLLTAFALGFKVNGLNICFMTWKRVNMATRFSFTPATFGGHVLAELEAMPRWKLVALFASGPIANLLASAGLYLLMRAQPSMNDNEQFVVFALMFMNLVMIAFSFSKRKGKIPTDGVQLRFLLGRDSGDYFRVAKVVTSWREIPPRDWDIQALEQIAKGVRDHSIIFWIDTLRCEQLCDRGDIELELTARELALAKRGDVRPDWKSIVDDLLLESASFFAVHRGDISRAKSLLDEVKVVGIRAFPTARRALISINLAEGELDLALKRILRAESKVVPSTSLAGTELDWTHRLKVRIVAAIEAREKSIELVAE